jgi:DnaJ like chaperone protein
MSIWGKIGGAAAGFIAGGPVGAALGGVLGHVTVDRKARAEPGVAFTIAIIALGAKMAKADGIATEDEEEIFKQYFRVPPAEEGNVHRIFRMARQDTAGFETYARQVANAFRGNPAVLEDIMDGLFEIAKADGVLHPGELAFLERVADIFGFAPNEFRRIRASHFPDKEDPYVILGVSHTADETEIRQTFLMLVRENHPDRLIARGVPPEFIQLANDKLAVINAAYDKIREERGLPR